MCAKTSGRFAAVCTRAVRFQILRQDAKRPRAKGRCAAGSRVAVLEVAGPHDAPDAVVLQARDVEIQDETELVSGRCEIGAKLRAMNVRDLADGFALHHERSLDQEVESILTDDHPLV